MQFIDLFAGVGGFTEAAGRAGQEVVWAANHWRTAVEFHERYFMGPDGCQYEFMHRRGVTPARYAITRVKR
jgi:site-specific DNA-cytosine methylase